MAFGFPAYHEVVINNIPAGTDVKRSAGSALARIGWNPKFEGQSILASTSLSMSSLGERVKVDVLPNGGLKIRSQCGVFLQCLDWGKNKKNVERFIQELPRHFVALQKQVSSLR